MTWEDRTAEFEQYWRRLVDRGGDNCDLHATARSWLQTKCQAGGPEYAVIIDERDGWVRAGTSGLPGRTLFSEEIIRRLDRRRAQIHGWHCHPDNEDGSEPGIAIPSDEDLQFLQYAGTVAIGVVNKELEWSISRRAPGMKHSAYEKDTGSLLMRAWSLAKEVIVERINSREPGDRTRMEEKYADWAEAMGRALHKAGVIEMQISYEERTPTLSEAGKRAIIEGM